MDDRKLTPAEEKRKVLFLETAARLEEQGYQQIDLSFSAVKANVMAIVMALPVLLAGAFLFYWKNGRGMIAFSTRWEPLCFLLAFLVSIVIHELIHGVTWSLFAKQGFRSIEFGFIAKYLTPYCACGEPLPFWGYLTGTLMPTLILGVGAYLIGLFFCQGLVALWGLLNVFSGGGDLYIIWCIRHCRKMLILDHPYEVGCIAFEKQ